MIEIKTKLQKWGNSFGIVVPVRFVQQEKMKEGDEVKVLVLPKENVNLKKMFGSHKFSKSVEELMKEMDKELYNE